MKKFVVLILVITGATIAYYYLAREDGNPEEAEIRAVLDRQTACWNKGNIDCFMLGYWKNDSLMFIGNSGITYGYKGTLERYKRNYPDKEAMGELEFTIMELRKVSNDVYLVVGRFMLNRTNLENLEGIFTLTVKKINNSWVIVADHTS